MRAVQHVDDDKKFYYVRCRDGIKKGVNNKSTGNRNLLRNYVEDANYIDP